MDKRGGVLAVIGIVFIVLILIGIGAGIYFYNYHVFKELRICVGEAEDLGFSCGVTEDCLVGFDYEAKLDGVPVFLRDEILVVLDEVVYCDGTCFVKRVRGFDLESGEVEMLDSCFGDETEFVVEVRGKEGLEILAWMRGLEDE